jgi:purine nucleoside phosphorylase
MYTPPDKNGQAVEMAAAYQAPLPGQQQTGVVGGSGNGNVDLEGGQTQQQQLPPRPAPSAATKVKDLLSRFKK